MKQTTARVLAVGSSDPIVSARMAFVRGDMANQIEINNRLVDEIERGLDISTRLSKMYKPNDKVSAEVLDYIREYEDTCRLFSTESINIDASCESAWEVVQNIIRELWRFLCKLWDGIKHCFRFIFSTQYRASSQAVKYRQQIALAMSSVDSASVWLHYEVDNAVSPEDLDKLLIAADRIITMLEKIPASGNTPEAIDNFLKTQVGGCGIEFRENQFYDTFSEIPWRAGSYESVGWKSIKQADEFAERYIKLTQRNVKLKNVEKDLASSISELQRQMNNRVAAGAELSDIQQKLLLKTKLFKVVQAGLMIMTNRINAIDVIIHDMSEDANDIANGTYKDE